MLNLLSSDNFIAAVKTYGLEHKADSNLVLVEVVAGNVGNIQPETASPNGMIPADRDALVAQMQAIHGPEYISRNWTGMVSNVVDGIVYEYKEDLHYGINYRNSVAYSVGMTLGSVIAKILSAIPVLSVPMAVIANVLDIAAATNTVLTTAGVIASYYGSAVYSRYVLVQHGGPYFESYKTIYYDGWVKEGYPGSAELVTDQEVYVPTQQLFEDYTLQRQRAYENYS